MMPYWILKVKELTKKAGDFDQVGQTLVEYALILASVAVIIIVILALLGVNLGATYETIAQAFPDLNLFSKTITIGHTQNEQGFIQWFLVDN